MHFPRSRIFWHVLNSVETLKLYCQNAASQRMHKFVHIVQTLFGPGVCIQGPHFISEKGSTNL